MALNPQNRPHSVFAVQKMLMGEATTPEASGAPQLSFPSAMSRLIGQRSARPSTFAH